jgi:large subunit ribosomal protein L10
MPSQQNKEYLQQTKDRLKDGTAFYFTDFTGLSVQHMETLRRELRKQKGNYVVLKNTIGFLAMKEMGFDEETIKTLFSGPTGIAIALEDPMALAKVITNHESLKIKGSFIDGKYFGADQVVAFARIPSKEVLYQQVVGSMNMIGSLVNVLEGIIRNLIGTLQGVHKKEAK